MPHKKERNYISITNDSARHSEAPYDSATKYERRVEAEMVCVAVTTIVSGVIVWKLINGCYFISEKTERVPLPWKRVRLYCTNSLVHKPLFCEMREHSLVSDHPIQPDSFSILANHMNINDLHIVESLFIYKQKPQTNSYCTAKILLVL